jgi:hypothetical protein
VPLLFNPKKTKALIISNNTNIPELNLRFNDESVELVDNHKHLGVTFVSDGNWTVHIENIARQDQNLIVHYLQTQIAFHHLNNF